VIRFCIIWLRVMVLALSLPFAVAAVDAFAFDDLTIQTDPCCSDCPSSTSGKCPTDCPDCHCHHSGTTAAVPEPTVTLVAVPTLERSAAQVRPTPANGPRQPALENLFRPPRRSPVT